MNIFTSLKLGQSTSLLSGYKAKAIIGSHNEVPFIPSLKNALCEQDIIISKPNYSATWSYPNITLCNNVEDLLSSMLLIRLRPSTCKGSLPAKWPAGALLLAGLTPEERTSALTEISCEIGLDLNSPNKSYALVCQSREVGTTTHHCYERGMFGDPKPDYTLKPETLTALKTLEKLPKQEPDVTLKGARGYMAFFETFGSHFVSSVTVGDVLLQVFSYESAEYGKLIEAYKDCPNDLRGPTAQSFVYFTVPHSKSTGYGYTAAIGKICIASDDPALADTLSGGLWDENEYAFTDSIFAPYRRSDSVDLNTAFKKTVITGIELSSLEVFAEYIRKQIFQFIFKAAMYCRYHNSTGVEPHFVNICPYDIDSIFKNSDPISGDGLLSTISTPSINVFKERFELSSLHIEVANIVKTFSIFTNALTITTSQAKVIDVPGSDSVTLIGHVISVRASSSSMLRPPTLCLSESAYSKVKAEIVCSKFYGGLLITTGQCSKALVVANGLVFEIINGGIVLTADVRLSYVSSNETIQKHITDMQFSLIAAEARLNYLHAIKRDPNQDVDAALTLIRSFLSWLGSGSADESGLDVQLLNVQARAMYLAKLAGTDRQIGTPVPYLKYKAYQNVIDSVQNALRTITGDIHNFQEQIRARKAEEREIDRENFLNENIIKSGKLLERYISAQASYQESIANQCSSVASEKVKKLEGAKRMMEKLSDALSEQRQTVRNAIENYKEAVTDWEKRQMVKAALNIASNLFDLAFTFVTPASSFGALKALGETVQRIQKAVKVFNAIIKAYEAFKSIPKSPDKVITALSSVGPKGLELPSSEEWDEIKVNMEAVLAKGPDISAKVTLSAAFAILVLRGKALIECQNTIQSIASELSSIEQQIVLSQQQKRRLSKLKVNFSAGPKDLDVETIDLVGLTGQLLFFERQMLMTLASVIVTQDAALQYEYLQPPVPIDSFSLLNLQLTIVNQAMTINRGLLVQPQPKVQEEPIVYEIHGVKAKNITSGNSLTFNIGLAKREFASYNYVRVLSVDAEVGGILSTDSGKYYIELTFEGQPFYDRDFNGEPRTFCTNSRLFTFLHDTSSSSHFKILDPCPPPAHTNAVTQFTISSGDDPFGDNISNITPFSTWKFSLPPSASNNGINFDDDPRGLTVRLTFHILAQLKENTENMDRIFRSAYLRSRIGHSICTCPHATKKQAVLIHTSLSSLGQDVSSTLSLIQSSSFDQDVSSNLSSVLLSISGQDVSSNQVLDMMRNKSVCAGWDVVFSMTAKQVNTQLALQYKDRVGQPEFVRETGEQVKEDTTSQGVVQRTRFSFQFKAPKLQFLLNNSNSAQVFFPIKCGIYEFAIKPKHSDWVIVSKLSVKESDGAYIQGDVPLSVFQGSVSTQHDVVVKLNEGSSTREALLHKTLKLMLIPICVVH